MASSIGIRVYKLEVGGKGSKDILPFATTLISRHPRLFIEDFIANRNAPTREKEAERSWYFRPEAGKETALIGYLHYGTFGFEASLVDHSTKEQMYRRKTTDVEEIPLYYQFWFPPNANFALIAFQSFQGRSCIQLVMAALQGQFNKENGEVLLRYSKLMPSDKQGGILHRAPVKRIRLIRRKAEHDTADRYIKLDVHDPIDIELVLSARRKRSLGQLGSILGKMPADTGGVIQCEGMDFNEAVADVNIGGRVRPVGLFGPNKDAGVIDITANIEKGRDGHPTFASLHSETESILRDFYLAITGRPA